MTRKGAILFLGVCFLAGIGVFVGSVLGNAGGQAGLYAGAMIGGIAGIFAATKVAVERQVLSPKRFWSGTIGGILGLILAALIATHHMDTPVVPLASILLIGLGAVVGAATRHGKSIDR